MAITTEEILKVLDIEQVENLDEFKGKFNKSFINRNIAVDDDEIKSKVVGKVLGGISTAMKREFELENKDIEGKKVEEILALGVQKTKSKISELEVSIGKTKDETVAEWETKANKFKKEAEEYKGQVSNLSKALDETKGGFEKEKKSWAITNKFGEAHKKVVAQFSEETAKDELKLEGFNTLVSKTFDFDVDESGEVIVLDKQGKRVQDSNKIGSFMNIEGALLSLATEKKLLKMNEAGQKVVTPKETVVVSEGNKTFVHPNATKYQVK